MLKWIWCVLLPPPFGICPKKKAYIRLSSVLDESIRASQTPMVVSLKWSFVRIKWPWIQIMWVRVVHMSKSSHFVKCAQNTIIISIVTLHWSWKSHNYKITSKTLTLLCRGKKKVWEATERWHTLCDVCLPVLVCRVGQQDDRSGDECHTVSRFIREGPSCHLFSYPTENYKGVNPLLPHRQLCLNSQHLDHKQNFLEVMR